VNLGDLLRGALRDAVRGRGTNAAMSINVNRAGRHTSVYSDDDVTIIDRDGEREVIRRDRAE
jgi:hypothetical protein